MWPWRVVLRPTSTRLRGQPMAPATGKRGDSVGLKHRCPSYLVSPSFLPFSSSFETAGSCEIRPSTHIISTASTGPFPGVSVLFLSAGPVHEEQNEVTLVMRPKAQVRDQRPQATAGKGCCRVWSETPDQGQTGCSTLSVCETACTGRQRFDVFGAIKMGCWPFGGP